MRILLVEDNDELASLIAEGFAEANYEIDRVATAAQARQSLIAARYAAVILDLGLPDADGLAVLRDMRERRDAIAVLVLTARADVQDRVIGLRAGADDYLTKPFALEELVARIEALLRRPRHISGPLLVLGNLSFDAETKQAVIGDAPQTLSAREAAVLEILLQRKDHVVSKKAMEDHLFGLDGKVSSNAVEVYVHRLRKQLSDGGATAQIHTVRGLGYMIAEVR
jgi:DNA-binding response OmpR family regulator